MAEIITNLLTRQIDIQADQTPMSPKISHAALLVASQVAKWSLRLIFVLVIARAMGPEKFGTYALIFGMVEFLAIASGAGYADYLTREAAKDERAGWGLALQLTLLRVAIGIPVAVIEIGILSIMRYPHAVLAGTAWMALTIIPRSLSEAVQGVLRGVHRYGSFLAVELTLGGGLVAGAVVVVLRHGGLSLAIASELVAVGAAGVVGLAFLLRFRTKEQIWLSGWQLVRRGTIFNAYSFIATLYDRFDVVLLSKLAGDYATGVYAVAYRALGMTQILPYGLLYSLLPWLSRNPQSGEGRARLEKALGLLLSVAFVVVLATMVFAGPAVQLLLGPRYAESAAALKILIWAVILRYANYAMNTALLAAGRERVFIVTSLVCLTVNIIGNLVFIPMYSWRAAALVTLTTELILLIQNLYWIQRAIGVVALPWTIGRTSIVFMALLVGSFAGKYFRSPQVVGAACLAMFAVYLFHSGIITEFTSIWRAERSPAG